MPALPRREFLSASALGLSTFAAGLTWGADKPAKESEKKPPKPLHSSSQESLFLTWWTDPTTTMVIQWIGAAGQLPTIKYAPLDTDAWQTANVITKPFPDTDLKVHRCELVGLTPGTEYQFCIGEDKKKHRFRTMPAKATNTFQFVTGGDCGTGKYAVMSNILAAKQEPYFTFIGGDLAYDNGRSPETFLKFVHNYAQHMIDPLGRLIPLLACPGNHEVNGGSSTKRSAAPHYLSVFDGLYKETSYDVLDFGDYLSLVMLDTGHLSPVKGAQTDWLAKTLAERYERPHLLVANHVPAYPSYRPSDKTGAENREFWCPLFERYRVDAVLEHHDHTFKRTHPLTGGLIDKYGVPYLGDGSWGQIRALKEPEKRPYLATYASAYHVSVHRLEGEARYHIALESNGKVADIYASTGKRPAKRG